MNLSIGDLNWESTSQSDDESESEFDFDYREYLSNDSKFDEDEASRALDGSFRWTDLTRSSDEIPELVRRRQSVDQLDDVEQTPQTENKCSTKLGERILHLMSSPTCSPRSPTSTLNDFLESNRYDTTRPLKSADYSLHGPEVTGFIDDISLDDTIFTTEDELEYIRLALETSKMWGKAAVEAIYLDINPSKIPGATLTIKAVMRPTTPLVLSAYIYNHWFVARKQEMHYEPWACFTAGTREGVHNEPFYALSFSPPPPPLYISKVWSNVD